MAFARRRISLPNPGQSIRAEVKEGVGNDCSRYLLQPAMCLIALLALFSARLALLVMWIFTNLVSRAFNDSFIVPLLGIIFLPWATLMYVLVWTPGHGVYGFGWFWVALGVVIDLGSYSSSAYSNRSRLGYA
jgi:hypothetical protein